MADSVVEKVTCYKDNSVTKITEIASINCEEKDHLRSLSTKEEAKNQLKARI